MKKNFSLLFLFFCTTSFAQNVGIGEHSPTVTKLQVKSIDSAIILLHNSNTIGSSIKTGLFFKTGTVFSGSIATVGSGGFHRMGFYTFGSAAPSGYVFQ